MTKNQLALIKNALYDAQKIEAMKYDLLPKVEVEHSEEYKRKIEELINQSRPHTAISIQKIAAILVAAALIFSLSIGAFAFMKPGKAFFIEMFEDHLDISVEGKPTRTKIEDFYTVKFLPDGFAERICDITDQYVRRTWEKDSEIIAFWQSHEGVDISTNFKDSEYNEIEINGIDITVVHNKKSYKICWLYNGYVFLLNCSYSIPWEQIEQMIRSVEVE